MVTAYELRIPTVVLHGLLLLANVHQRWRATRWHVATKLMHDDPTESDRPTHRHNGPIFVFLNSTLIITCALLLGSSVVAICNMDVITGSISGWPHLGQVLAFDTAICALISCLVMFEYILWQGFAGVYVCMRVLHLHANALLNFACTPAFAIDFCFQSGSTCHDGSYVFMLH